MNPTDYVVRSYRSITRDRVVVTIVDMGGRVVHVTMPRNTAAGDQADELLRVALTTPKLRRPVAR